MWASLDSTIFKVVDALSTEPELRDKEFEIAYEYLYASGTETLQEAGTNPIRILLHAIRE